jgi:cysteine-rich repeat protein
MKLFYPLLLLPLLAGCPFAKCGDGETNRGEACDDGNLIDADGCEANCSLPTCNNGIVDPGELCLGEPVSFATDEAPIEPATADINGDGHQDILTANALGNSVSVLISDGNGNLSRQADVDLGSPAVFITVGDFDGDQFPDFAVSLFDVDTIEVFRGVGDGTFEPLTTLTANNSVFLVTADFNQDNNQDLITSSDDGVVLFLNDGVGVFQAPRISFIGGVDALAVADFDGNETLDAATRVDNNLVFLLGDGLGNFAPQPAQLDGEIQGRLTAGDFNGDKLPDLAAAQFSNGFVNIFINQAGAFTQTQTFSIFGPVALTAADLNQDNTPDLAIASDADLNLEFHLAVLSSDPENFTAQDPVFAGSGNVEGITTSDLNEDTVPDVILTNTSNSRLVLFLSQP